jgi:glutamine synthetase
MDAAAAIDWLDERGINTVRVEATSLEGPLLGKHVSRAKFDHALPDGLCLADFALAMDIAGTPQLGWWADWRQAALGDMYLRPDLATLVVVPEEPGLASCLGHFTDVSGVPLPVCPRSVLQNQVDALSALHLEARCAFELEFFVIEERIDAARARQFAGLTPLGGRAPKMAYLTQRTPEFLPLLREVTTRLEALGIPWEAFNDEAAPGQFELNLAPADPVTAADRTVLAKRVLRDVAYAHGRSVTFMAKPFADLYGSGLHVHTSLWRDGDAMFASQPDGTQSELLRHWIGGSIATIGGATSMLLPTINSFRRQVDFAAAPTTPTWGEENKGAALRTITRAAASARVEHRVAAADANPYLVLAAVLAGGIAGLEERIEPPEPAHELPWGLPADRPRLPKSIHAAADALGRSEQLRKRLGDTFVEHWVEGRKWEWLMFHTSGGDPEATTTTPWELGRYFEWV